MPLVSRSRLAIHERHFSNGVWIYLGMGRRWRKDESAENIKFQVCNGRYIRMESLEKLRYTLQRLVLGRLDPSKKSRILVFVSERDCIHNTLYYTSNKLNSQQPLPFSAITTAIAKTASGLLVKGQPCQGQSQRFQCEHSPALLSARHEKTCSRLQLRRYPLIHCWHWNKITQEHSLHNHL